MEAAKSAVALLGQRETDSIWSSISLDSPTRCRGKHLSLEGAGTALSHLSNPGVGHSHSKELSDSN